jgi:transcriptional regulator with PAS, ATPase and Fis domain
LSKLVKKGTFRQDLYYRINVFPIQMPALRERTDDIVPLAEFFLSQLSDGKEIRLTDGAIRTLQSYSWPGNVRELTNAMERVMIINSGDGSITAETLSFLRIEPCSADMTDQFKLPPNGVALEALQFDFVRQSLELTGNNQTAAANLLGLTRAKFRVLLKQAAENGH